MGFDKDRALYLLQLRALRKANAMQCVTSLSKTGASNQNISRTN